MSSNKITKQENIEVSIDVRIIEKHFGEEIVQRYICDLKGKVVWNTTWRDKKDSSLIDESMLR